MCPGLALGRTISHFTRRSLAPADWGFGGRVSRPPCHRTACREREGLVVFERLAAVAGARRLRPAPFVTTRASVGGGGGGAAASRKRTAKSGSTSAAVATRAASAPSWSR